MSILPAPDLAPSRAAPAATDAAPRDAALRDAALRDAAPRDAAPRDAARCDDAFVAIDFETADPGPDSACAVALVRVEGQRVVRREHRLIRPPRSRFHFTHIHGLQWKDVEACPTFGEVWADLVPVLAGARFLAAHNAAFDRRVLAAGCGTAGREPPTLPWRCTVQVARAAWRLFPTRLPDVCRYLGIPLVHHDPLSDAEACARIVVAAAAQVAVLPTAS